MFLLDTISSILILFINISTNIVFAMD